MTKRRRAKTDRAQEPEQKPAAAQQTTAPEKAPPSSLAACVDCGRLTDSAVHGRCTRCELAYNERQAAERKRILKKSHGRLDD
jgi:tRNA(Ile2) C34 agmatinyltransferase TiaS